MVDVAKKVMAAVLTEPYKIALREFDIPEIGTDDGLLKVEMTGICGTDVKIFKGDVTNFPLPLIMGHEVVGRVAAVGKNAQQAFGVKEGDRVVVEANLRCGYCEACLKGEYKYCSEGKAYGLKASCSERPFLWGAYAEYMYLAPGSALHKIPESLPGETAVLINAVLANGIQWVNLMGSLQVGDTVMVMGMGPQGFAAAIAAREGGAREVFMVGLDQDMNKAGLAKKFGCNGSYSIQSSSSGLEKLKGMVDLIVDTTGSQKSLLKSQQFIKRQGTIIIAGIQAGNPEVQIDANHLVMNEIKVKGVYSKGHEAVLRTVKFVKQNRYPFIDLVTHRFNLLNVEEALNFASSSDSSKIKVVISP